MKHPSAIRRILPAIVLLATCVTLSCAPAAEEEPGPDDERTKLLKVFRAEFVPITPGKGEFPKKFTMGSVGGETSERPPHDVTLEVDFSMACYEVPQNLYAAVTGRNPSAWKGPRNSVEMVTWNDAVKFCRAATKLMREAKLIVDDEEIRLPSEAEWEYCCRAGTITEYSFGDSATGPGDIENAASLLDQYAWHTGNAAGNDPPVGAKKPNAWGLYDMHGYLWEYVSDSWHATYDEAPANSEPWKGAKPGGIRVMRGGSWRERHEQLRSATRWPIPDHARSEAIGFRCVKAKVPRSSQ